jgi:hypothetical protein
MAVKNRTFISVDQMMQYMDRSWEKTHWIIRASKVFKWRVLDTVWHWISPYQNYRRVCWIYQWMTRGFSDRQTWDLDFTIANFILPRLKRFKELDTQGIPGGLPSEKSQHLVDKMTEKEYKDYEKVLVEEWECILSQIIESFQLIVDDEWDDIADWKRQQEIIQEGLQLFVKWFRALNW